MRRMGVLMDEPVRTGYCSRTALGGDCDKGSSGGWRASVANGTLSGCRRLCLACAACNFVSFSLQANDCSWYRTCRLPLEMARPGEKYTAVLVRTNTSYMLDDLDVQHGSHDRSYEEYRLDKRTERANRAGDVVLGGIACRDQMAPDAVCALQEALLSPRWWDSGLAIALLPRVEGEEMLPSVVNLSLFSCRQKRSCPHAYGHRLGRALAMLTTHGADITHPLSALSLCGKSFQLGCFHGAVQGALMRTIAATEPAVPIDVSAAIDGRLQTPSVAMILLNRTASVLHDWYGPVCSAAGTAGIEYGECVHAIGHVAFMIGNGNVDDAHAVCHRLAAAQVAEEGERGAALYYCVQGVAMEAGIGRKQLDGAKWCAASLAPGPCLSYWWLGARIDGLQVMQSGGAAGRLTPEKMRRVLAFCQSFGRCTAAHLGCLNGAASASTHPLVPNTPACTSETLAGTLRDWMLALTSDNVTWPPLNLTIDGDDACPQDRLGLALVDGFLRRGSKYFPTCQAPLCVDVPLALHAGCERITTPGRGGGMYTRQRWPDFGLYLSSWTDPLPRQRAES